MVWVEGLEPSCLAAADFKSATYTDSVTPTQRDDIDFKSLVSTYFTIRARS